MDEMAEFLFPNVKIWQKNKKEKAGNFRLLLLVFNFYG